MKAQWTARLAVQTAFGLVVLFVANWLLADKSRPESFKVAGVVLTGMAAALVIADAFFNAAVKKLDEAVIMPSFSLQQRKTIRADLRRMETSLTTSFYISTLCKSVFGITGLLFTAQLIHDVVLCGWLFRIGFFLLGFALPNVVIMPRSYFAAKDARLELIEMEEQAALKAKLLESLQKDPEHDFATDAHFAGFGRVVNPGSRATDC